MSAGHQFESPIAQFQENPFTRNWPEPAAVDALFRYCVKRFTDVCLADPRIWLTSDDLRSLLAQILREELPSHGLPAYAIHLGYSAALIPKPDATKPVRHNHSLDLVLLMPDTIHWDANNKAEAVLAVAAAVQMGFDAPGSGRENIARLAALKKKLPETLCYLVAVGFQDSEEAIEALKQTAAAANIVLLSANYTGLADLVRQDKLL